MLMTPAPISASPAVKYLFYYNFPGGSQTNFSPSNLGLCPPPPPFQKKRQQFNGKLDERIA